MTDNWLNTWVDEFSVTSPARAIKLGRDRVARARLDQLAEGAKQQEEPPQDTHSSESAIVAGRALDLSGLMTCGHAGCLVAKVDTLFNEIWHYFDTVIVEGPSPSLFHPGNPSFEWNLKQHVQVLLYLRKIGAMPYLKFRRKPMAFCTHHFEEAARKGGLDSLLDEGFATAAVEEILRTATLTPVSDGARYEFTYADSDVVTIITPTKKSKHPPDIRELARMEFMNTAVALVGDVSLSRYLEAPLVQSAEVRKRIRLKPVAGVTTTDVALNLRLPVIRNLPVSELLALRKDHWPELIRFRAALRLAIEEELKRMVNEPDRSPSGIAQQVVQRHLEPELAAIDRKLKVAEQALTKKSAITLAVGSTIATVGLLAGAPLVLAAGMTALGSFLLHANKYVEERGAIELSDMQFLWQVRAASH